MLEIYHVLTEMATEKLCMVCLGFLTDWGGVSYYEALEVHNDW